MFQTKRIFALFFLFVISLFAAQDTLACSCAEKPSVQQYFDDSKLVVATKLISVEKIKEKEGEYDIRYIKSAKMVVEKVYKGNIKVGDELTFGQGGGSDCRWTFDEKWVGGKFLFYLGEPIKGQPVLGDKEDDIKDSEQMYYASGCGRSNALDYAFDDLAYLNNIDKLRGKTRISGILTSWSGAAPSFADIKIKIIGKNKTYEAKTDKNGFYEIYDLPAGEYLIEPQIPKGWKINEYMLERSSSYTDNYGSRLRTKDQIPIVLKEKRHAGLDLYFDIDNAIRGKVISPVGKPMQGVCITAVSTALEDGDYRGRSDCTDEKGEFQIEQVSPGNYILVVNDDGKVSSKEPFGTLFYPGTADRKQAGVVSIEIGKFVNDVNIQIPKLAVMIQISGRLLYSDGKPAKNESVKFEAYGVSSANEAEVRGETDAQGRFTIKILQGIRGRVVGVKHLFKSEFEDCPEVRKMLEETNQFNTYVTTNPIQIAVDETEDLSDIELTFPFQGCPKGKE